MIKQCMTIFFATVISTMTMHSSDSKLSPLVIQNASDEVVRAYREKLESNCRQTNTDMCDRRLHISCCVQCSKEMKNHLQAIGRQGLIHDNELFFRKILNEFPELENELAKSLIDNGLGNKPLTAATFAGIIIEREKNFNRK